MEHNRKKKTSLGSAFYFFMMEQKEMLVKGGLCVDTETELEAAAYPAWHQLLKDNPEQVGRYMRRANTWKLENETCLKNKFDQSGRNLEQIKKEEEMKFVEKEDQEFNIKKTVESGKRKGNLVTKKFYIAYFNTLCETLEGFHIPCEAGIVEYSVENGLGKCFQEFISPIQIPLGYKYQCLKKSKETHNIPPDDFEWYVDNYKLIFDAIKKFMTDDELPPLYVMPDHVDAALSIVKLISKEANSGKTIKVYKLPQLLYELRKAAPDVDMEMLIEEQGNGTDSVELIQSVSTAVALLEKETFKYWRGLGCDFHEALDNCYCALAKAKGLAYLMAAVCSKPFNITIRPNKHTPPNNEIDFPGHFSTFAKTREIVKQAVMPESTNPWGTKISILAAPAGVTFIPSHFDPNSVELGYGAEKFPGLHPEIVELNQPMGASGYNGGESNCVDYLSDDEVDRDKSMASVRSLISSVSTIKYGESDLAGLVSRDPGKLKLPSLTDPNKGTLHPLANRPGSVQDQMQEATSHLELGRGRERDCSGIETRKKSGNSRMIEVVQPESRRAQLLEKRDAVNRVGGRGFGKIGKELAGAGRGRGKGLPRIE